MFELIVRPSFSNENGGSFVLIEPGQNGDLIIEDPFFIGARPVTPVEWAAVMGSNPSKFQEGWSAGLRPVESVSWRDCQSFIAKLNETETEQRLVSGIWRLPNATEWELHAGQVLKHDGIILTATKTSMKLLGMPVMLVQQLGKLVKKRKMNGACMIAMVMWLNGPIVEMTIAASLKEGHG